jgi:hypothetical protein
VRYVNSQEACEEEDITSVDEDLPALEAEEVVRSEEEGN